MAKQKAKPDHRADTRGGGWVGIPHAVVDSDAYRSLSLWARAVLVEIARRFNGYNNGKIGISVSEICAAVDNSSRARAARAVAELIEHGLLDITTDARWKQRMAREYRLTFISTGGPGHHVPATNEYRQWRKDQKSRGNTVLPEKPPAGNTSLPVRLLTGNTPLPAEIVDRRKSAKNADQSLCPAGNSVFPLIGKPSPNPGNGVVAEHENGRAPLDEESLRKAAIDLVKQVGRGSQGRLAHLAGINEGKFSTFLHQRQTLPAPSLARLKRAIGQMAA